MRGICDLCDAAIGPYGSEALNICALCYERLSGDLEMEMEPLYQEPTTPTGDRPVSRLQQQVISDAEEMECHDNF